LLEEKELDNFGSLKHISTLAEVLYTTKLFRERFADRNLRSNEIFKFLEREDFINTFKRIVREFLNLWGNTTHLAVSDREGNVVSTTTTNGEGSGYVIPGFGVMLNNMLGEEDLNPEGFFKWPPYTRLPSMMCPTMVFKDEELLYAYGSAGSNRIRSAVLQVLVNLVDFKMNPEEAVEAPRLHVEGGTLYLEPPLGERFLEKLEKMFKVVRFSEKNVFFGGVQLVAPPLQSGAGDPRRGGVVLTF
jgi:gamma-glutamyltranspeptidase/glutathione hydrolase